MSLNSEEIVFDIKGIEPPLANALRRILISEIPTMAIEIANIWQNTSVIPDEVLSHRLGLIPILADANDFRDRKESEEFNEFNSIHFKLHAKYDKKAGNTEGIDVLSSKIEWTPIGNQARQFADAKALKVVFDDILIAKLRPGQVTMQIINF